MRRRRALGALSALALTPAATRAQARVARIAYLSSTTAESSAGYVAAFRKGLEEHGLVEGRDVAIEFRYAGFRFDDLARLAREIAASRPDVIVTQVTEASRAVRAATTTIPHVFAAVGDPVAAGLVANLSRPGGNVTGTASMTTDVAGKTVALLKEAVPTLKRAAVLWNPANATYQRLVLREVQKAAASLGLETRTYPMTDTAAIERSFEAMGKDGVGGLVVLSDVVILTVGARIAALARDARLPSVCGLAVYADQGGLVGYGPDFPALFRAAAEPVARILRGARPGDIPIARPTRFELVVNATTAKAIGIAIPPALSLRADRMVE